MNLVRNIFKVGYCKYYVELRAEIDVRENSLEQIYAVLAAPCATIPIPYTNTSALSVTIAAFRVSLTTICVKILTFYATIAAVWR
jgi:hypothetical protein